MLYAYFKSMMTGDGGGISSKRNAMVFFILVFTTLVFLSCRGINASEYWQDQVAQVTKICIAAVFGEKVINLFVALKSGKPIENPPPVQQPEK